ncbi:MAG: AI-2E family transporter [Phycisphaeraceae bacterium]|nr:AI-2E family transporter [Phycisphaeraceae bacterium]
MTNHNQTSNNDPKKTHLWDYCWVRDLLFIVATLAVLWMAYSIRSVIAPIFVGFAFAYVFNPLVTWANLKIKWPRWLISLLILVFAYVGLASVLIYVVPQAYKQGQQITDTVRQAIKHNADQIDPFYRVILEQFPSIGDSLKDPTEQAPKQDATTINPDSVSALPIVQTQKQTQVVQALVEELAGNEVPLADNTDSKNPSQLDSDMQKSLKDLNINYPMLGRVIMRIFNVGVGAVGSAFSLASYLALLLVIISLCFFFFSWKLGPFLEWFKPLIPLDVRERSLHILSEIDRSTNAFVRGRLVQSLVMGIILSVGWMFAGVPSWLLLGILCGFLNLIPFAAALGFLAALGLTIMSITTNDASFTWGLLVWPTVVYCIAQLADGWIVEPLVQGKATNLDPLTVMLAVIIGGALMGLVGMLLAIPLASSIKILSREWLVPELKSYAESRKPDKLINKQTD